jgi:hypothetical protein
MDDCNQDTEESNVAAKKRILADEICVTQGLNYVLYCKCQWFGFVIEVVFNAAKQESQHESSDKDDSFVHEQGRQKAYANRGASIIIINGTVGINDDALQCVARNSRGQNNQDLLLECQRHSKRYLKHLNVRFQREELRREWLRAARS